MPALNVADRFVQHCQGYFQILEKDWAGGPFPDGSGTCGIPYYPTVVLASNTPTHTCLELLGASPERPRSLTVLRRDIPTLADLLGAFPAKETHYWMTANEGDTGEVIFENLRIVPSRNRTAYESRYGGFGGLHSGVVLAGDPAADPSIAFYPVDISDRIRDITLRNVIFAADWRGQVRSRYFQCALIVRRDVAAGELKQRLQSTFPIGGDTRMLAPCTDTTSAPLVNAANFASLAAIGKIGETTITKFLEKSAAILATALRGDSIIAQPQLEWLEGNSDPDEEFIQPDFLLVDDTNHAHVCEVKLPLLENSSLTRGGHRRRRFLSPVMEGLAQLANYSEYFAFERHRTLLRDRYRVEIAQNHRQILIIGSSENYKETEVREAERMLRPVELVDYDTLRGLYLLGSE